MPGYKFILLMVAASASGGALVGVAQALVFG